jgi:CO/xanthine dehydrogenase FAD-binding subunit
MLNSFHVPSDLQAAFDALDSSRSSVLMSGGTLLMPEINTEPSSIDTLVSLRGLALSGISATAGRAAVGATTTLDAFGRHPELDVLRPVIESIASPPIRNMATVGGNLFAAQPYGDLAVALLALDAEVALASRGGARNAPVSQILRNGIAEGEIVTAISFDIPAAGSWFYNKAMRRKLNSAAIVTVAASVVLADRKVAGARIALGGAAPRPVRAPSVEAALIGRPLDTESVTAAAHAAVNDIEPFSDAYASAWYRARVLPVHIRRALLGD